MVIFFYTFLLSLTISLALIFLLRKKKFGLDVTSGIQKIHNNELDIEGLLLTMYDMRLRLSNQVVEEVRKHFGKMVFKTIIQRNIKLSEAPSFGEDIIKYDVSSRGAKSYLSLGNEIIKRNKQWENQVESKL